METTEILAEVMTCYAFCNKLYSSSAGEGGTMRRDLYSRQCMYMKLQPALQVYGTKSSLNTLHAIKLLLIIAGNKHSTVTTYSKSPVCVKCLGRSIVLHYSEILTAGPRYVTHVILNLIF